MTPAEVAAILRQFNEWRRSDYEPSEQPAPPDPREIGEAIDAAVEMIERMQKALSFYSDENRYYGPNQRYEGGDPWTDAAGLRAYQLDVTRDRGNIARAALEESK